ncbi:MAG: SIS domain-containing protein [Clostridia bacterium]|nr:SIS domain-containing protein [Clostridia bacterium]
MTKMWKEIFEQPSVLKNCIKNNSQLISEIVDSLRKRQIYSIIIAARGTSDHAGVYGKYIIETVLGIPVALAAPSVFTVYGKKLNMEKSLVIGISQSGKAADVLEVIREANKQGAVTVSITNFVDSPLAIEARHHLWCNAGLEESVAATKTFTSQIMLLAQLVAKWAQDKAMIMELDNVPENVEKALEISDIIKEKVQRYRYMNECFVLSRGINYSIALEGALKIQETTYVKAKAFATSDFHHGPFAMVEKDTPVIIYAPYGPSFKDTGEMVEKLKQSQAELIIVSNSAELLEKGNCSFIIPAASNDIISPFYNVVIAQMFACQLSLAKGLDPDKPRGLNKVTITK